METFWVDAAGSLIAILKDQASDIGPSSSGHNVLNTCTGRYYWPTLQMTTSKEDLILLIKEEPDQAPPRVV